MPERSEAGNDGRPVRDPNEPGRWTEGTLPRNVRVGRNTLITGRFAFNRFRSRAADALVIDADCTMDGVQFALGEAARVEIGDYCYFTNAVILCEERIQIGRYVVIGWNATITDTDFHPIDPAERIADALACSPLGRGRPRPRCVRAPVVIEDDVWIGPNATIFKGVTLGTGSWIEAGAVVTHDVPPGRRVLGNPARIVEEI
jgi:acetyltransferase-like isoleucine patch superfamily enzyme